MVQFKKNATIARESERELKPFRLGNISNPLTAKEMQRYTGGYDEGGYGGYGKYCEWYCLCQEFEYTDFPPFGDVGIGLCKDAPWDRNPDCETGYQDCVFTFL